MTFTKRDRSISADTLPLPSGAATAAKQLADDHNVTVSSSALPSGAATAVNQFIDPMLEIARGNVSGMSHVNKFGENPDVVKNTTEDVWDGGGTYSFPATALMTKISQTTDQGDMQGETIEVQGLDESWDLVVQNVDLDDSNTETPVTLDTPLIRCFRMKVLANYVTTSPIRVHNDAENVDYAIIDTGNNQTLMAIYTVPDGKTAYLTNYYADTAPTGSGTKDPYAVKIKLWFADRDNSYEFQIKHEKGLIQDGAHSFQHFFKPYYKATQKTDIKISAFASNDWNGHVHAGFDLILVDN